MGKAKARRCSDAWETCPVSAQASATRAIDGDFPQNALVCVEITLGGNRKRITLASQDAAKVEAQKIITQIASGRSHEQALTFAETDDYGLVISTW